MIRVDVDIRGAVRALDDIKRRQVPYALSKAINTTATEAQDAIRDSLSGSFTLRRKDWGRRSIKIGRGDFATKTRPRAMVRLEAPGDSGRSDILGKFEDGGVKRPKGGKRLAIPAEVRRGKTGVVGRSARPKAFNFMFVGRSSAGVEVYHGAKRTFMVKRPDGTGGIYQRAGKKVGKRGRRTANQGRRMASSIGSRGIRDLNVRTLYRFTPDARIDSRLHFEEIAVGVIRARFSRNFQEALQKAIAGGRGQLVQRGALQSLEAGKGARRMARADLFEIERAFRRRRR